MSVVAISYRLRHVVAADLLSARVENDAPEAVVMTCRSMEIKKLLFSSDVYRITSRVQLPRNRERGAFLYVANASGG